MIPKYKNSDFYLPIAINPLVLYNKIESIINSNHIKWKEGYVMSNRELAKSLIDQIPESKLVYIIYYLRGAAIPDEIPNKETIEAIREI